MAAFGYPRASAERPQWGRELPCESRSPSLESLLVAEREIAYGGRSYNSELTMPTDYAKVLFFWRDHAGDMRAQPKATIGTMLWTCQRWLEVIGDGANEKERERVLKIMQELQKWPHPE
jgi:hypothetical protein